MNSKKAMTLLVGGLLAGSVCLAADQKQTEAKSSDQAAPQIGLFTTNAPAGHGKTAPFSSEISADFIKKVMETSARIEECKKQIAERQAYIYEHNDQIKAYRTEMIGMQTKINKLLEADKELAELRLNRDMLWTTMPVLPRPREQQMGPRRMGPAIGKTEN